MPRAEGRRRGLFILYRGVSSATSGQGRRMHRAFHATSTGLSRDKALTGRTMLLYSSWVKRGTVTEVCCWSEMKGFDMDII